MILMIDPLDFRDGFFYYILLLLKYSNHSLYRAELSLDSRHCGMWLRIEALDSGPTLKPHNKHIRHLFGETEALGSELLA